MPLVKVDEPRHSSQASVQARNGAEDEGRTRDLLLGKEALYH